MEADAPPPDPPAESPPPESGGPTLSTPVIVAMLSLSGVIGGALLSNWDKIFGHHARPVPAAATEAAPAKLQGVWLSPVAQHPYQPDRRFRLRVEVNAIGGEITGRVSDVAEGGAAPGPAHEILSPKPAGDGIDFQVTSRWCCEDGKERPYEILYQLRPTSQGLAVTRRNNAPGGGQVERFLLSRE